MKATITIVYRPLKPHERTGGPNLPWLGETLLSAPLVRAARTGTCRGATFVDALNMCVAGLVGHYRDDQPDAEHELDEEKGGR